MQGTLANRMQPIGLTDLPNIWGASGPPGPPGSSITDCDWLSCIMGAISKFMGKTFQAAQLTHERFLTIDHSCKISELPQTSGV